MEVTGCDAGHKGSAGVAEMDLRKCTLHLPQQKRELGRTHSCFETSGETSPKIQNRGISGPQNRTHVSDKNFKKIGEQHNTIENIYNPLSN